MALRPATLDIVAAENFYGDITQQIGEADVAVMSILSNPDQDPHEFEAGPSVARKLANAALVIYNSVDYDLWVPKLSVASLCSNES
jgi:zinc/manganese transport system substrate-binding protein